MSQWARSTDESGFTVIERPDGSKMLVDPAMLEYMDSEAPQPTQASFAPVLEQVASVAVHDDGVAGSQLLGQRLLMVDDAAELDALRASLRIEDGGAGHCMCHGDIGLQLRDAAGEALAVIGVHHGRSIRWEAWKDDAELVDGRSLVDWLARQGVEEPLAEFLQSEAEAVIGRRAYESWIADAPPSLSKLLEVDDLGTPWHYESWPEALTSAYPDVGDRVLALLAWHAHGDGSLVDFYGFDEPVDGLLASVRTLTLVNVLERPGLKPEHLTGAARFFLGRDADDRVRGLPRSLQQRLRAHVESSGNEADRERAQRLAP
ncbi:MAG: hypothetical protein QNJ90_15795 [Planctomycetota bacterium]|nr:hypothetical protein [Planctomycetota bacterium]